MKKLLYGFLTVALLSLSSNVDAYKADLVNNTDRGVHFIFCYNKGGEFLRQYVDMQPHQERKNFDIGFGNDIMSATAMVWDGNGQNNSQLLHATDRVLRKDGYDCVSKRIKYEPGLYTNSFFDINKNATNSVWSINKVQLLKNPLNSAEGFVSNAYSYVLSNDVDYVVSSSSDAELIVKSKGFRSWGVAK